MARYYGPRFYRVRWDRWDNGEEEWMAFDDARAEAKAHADRLANGPFAVNVRLETIDDRYPANVLSSEIIPRHCKVCGPDPIADRPCVACGS